MVSAGDIASAADFTVTSVTALSKPWWLQFTTRYLLERDHRLEKPSPIAETLRDHAPSTVMKYDTLREGIRALVVSSTVPQCSSTFLDPGAQTQRARGSTLEVG